MFKKCADSGGDLNMALLQICTNLLGQGLPSPATLMLNRQVCGIMPVLDCKPVGQECDDKHHSKLVDRQNKNNNAMACFRLSYVGCDTEVIYVYVTELVTEPILLYFFFYYVLM